MMSCVLAILAAAAIFQGVDAQCYNCTLITTGGLSVGPAGCGEPFDSTGIITVPCADKCKTDTATTAAEGNQPAITAVTRACHDPDVEGPCVDVDNVEVVPGTNVTRTCCMGALCNGGSEPPATTPSSAGFLTFSAVLAVFAPLGAFII